MTQLFAKQKNSFAYTIRQFLVLLSFVAAVAYGFGYTFDAYVGTGIVKSLAVGLLALYVLSHTQSLNHFLLFAALGFGTAGDYALTMDLENAFTNGLTAFLIGHLFYIVLFFRNRQPKELVSRGRVRVIALLWLVAALALVYIYPILQGPLQISVIAYTLVITSMATMALISRFPVWIVGLGAVLFVISDAALAAREFLTAPDWVGNIVWVTYYGAQLLLALGVMHARPQPIRRGGYYFD